MNGSEQQHRFVYLSRAKTAPTDEDLRSLCARANAWNKEVGITGQLLFDGARYLQVIEGPVAPVVELMSRIRTDTRHDSIEMMSDEPIEARAFGDWAMAFQHVHAGACTAEFLRDVKDGVAEVADAALRATFIGFAVLATVRKSR